MEKEITILEIDNGGKRYKVTRRIPGMSTADTVVFDNKNDAERQVREWLE